MLNHDLGQGRTRSANAKYAPAAAQAAAGFAAVLAALGVGALLLQRLGTLLLALMPESSGIGAAFSLVGLPRPLGEYVLGAYAAGSVLVFVLAGRRAIDSLRANQATTQGASGGSKPTHTEVL